MDTALVVILIVEVAFALAVIALLLTRLLLPGGSPEDGESSSAFDLRDAVVNDDVPA